MPLDLIGQIGVIEKAEKVALAVGEMKAVTQGLDDAAMLYLCRDLMVEQISQMIYKFPLKTQKELVAMLADRHLAEWAKLENGVRRYDH